MDSTNNVSIVIISDRNQILNFSTLNYIKYKFLSFLLIDFLRRDGI